MSPITRKYLNREIAWLSFNERVLQEAADLNVPVLERITFLGIFSNNMDEFFKVRVASVKRLITHKKTRIEYNIDPQRTLKEIRKVVAQQLKYFEEVFEMNIAALKKQGIYLINEKQVTKKQEAYIRDYFSSNIRSYIYPVSMSKLKNSEGLSDKSNYLCVQLSRSDKPQMRESMLIEIPVAAISRFLVLPRQGKKYYVILLDDVIRICLDNIFSFLGYDRYEAYTFKFIRDAELDIDYAKDDLNEFTEYLSRRLKDRNSAKAVRLVHDKRMPKEFLKRLSEIFQVEPTQVFDSEGRYQNKKDFTNFPRDFDLANLQYPLFERKYLNFFSKAKSIFETLREKDIMLHYPYQSFQYVIDLLREASLDPKVISIKMTIYRVAKASAVMNALLSAVRNKKKVAVYMELMARFDEENNLDWVRRLEDVGVEVYPLIPGIKVHAKLIHICRKENGKKVYYSCIGTGNPNELTARMYTDCHLLTAKPKITKEVDLVFKNILSPDLKVSYKELLVSPYDSRSDFEDLIDQEIKNAKAGKPAWIKACFNNLADEAIVDRLYEAGKANVKIQLLVRGICILKAGVKGMSENIEVRSIVNRFLEHSRIFIFANQGKPRYFIGSADWMTRNLDYRVEVITPIYDKEIQEDLFRIMELKWMDNTHSRIISPKQDNTYYRDGAKKQIDSQIEIHKYLLKKYSR